MGAFDFTTLFPMPSFLPERGKEKSNPLGERYWQNDGVVPLFSQWHPLDCSSTQCIHHACGLVDGHSRPPGHDEEMGKINELTPGMWHVYTLEDANHCSIAPQWMGTQRQKQFWEGVGRWLVGVERRRGR